MHLRIDERDLPLVRGDDLRDGIYGVLVGQSEFLALIGPEDEALELSADGLYFRDGDGSLLRASDPALEFPLVLRIFEQRLGGDASWQAAVAWEPAEEETPVEPVSQGARTAVRIIVIVLLVLVLIGIGLLIWGVFGSVGDLFSPAFSPSP